MRPGEFGRRAAAGRTVVCSCAVTPAEASRIRAAIAASGAVTLSAGIRQILLAYAATHAHEQTTPCHPPLEVYRDD